MDSPIPTQLEVEVQAAVGMVLDDCSLRLKEVGIRAVGPDLERTEGPDGWDADVSVSLYRGDDLVEMFSYGVWRGGVPDRTPNEVAGDLFQDITAVVNEGESFRR